jgi:hypothetical protein
MDCPWLSGHVLVGGVRPTESGIDGSVTEPREPGRTGEDEVGEHLDLLELLGIMQLEVEPIG